MKRLHKDSRGFSAEVLILIIVIVVAIGGIGYMVWQRNQSEDNTSTTESKNAASEGKKETSPEPAKSQANLIVLPQMKTQFEVPDSLKDLTFKETYSKANTSMAAGQYGSEAYPIALFSLPAIEGGDCQLSDQGGPLGSAWKVSGQYPTNATSDTTPGPLVKQFSNYYLAFRRPGMSCSSDPAKQAQLTALQDQLIEALKTSSEVQ